MENQPVFAHENPEDPLHCPRASKHGLLPCGMAWVWCDPVEKDWEATELWDEGDHFFPLLTPSAQLRTRLQWTALSDRSPQMSALQCSTIHVLEIQTNFSLGYSCTRQYSYTWRGQIPTTPLNLEEPSGAINSQTNKRLNIKNGFQMCH